MSTVSSPRRTEIVAALLGGVLGALLVGTTALAHTGLPAGGLVDGVLHPLRGIDHLLAMVASASSRSQLVTAGSHGSPRSASSAA